MDHCLINPVRSAGDPELPPTGLLALNPADSQGFAALARRFALLPHRLFNAQLYAGDHMFLAGPAVGAPMAVLCLEKLIALGARQVVVYGWCGALHPSLHAEDLLLPTHGLSEEGTSAHYFGDRDGVPATCPDGTLSAAVTKALAAQGTPCHQGGIWTTDALFRETRHKVTTYASRGIMAVDMEFTALCAVAAFRRIRLAGLMLVSDELYHPQWAPRVQYKRFRARSRQTLEQLCSLLPTLTTL